MSKTGIRKTIVFLHFLLTFLIERLIFTFSWSNIEFMVGAPKNYYIGDKTEMVMTYALSKAFAFILIILLWKLIFQIIDKKIDVKLIKLFGRIFIIGLVIGAFLFPDIIFGEIDNYAGFALAIRFLPYYWHSIFTSTLYAGCMMIIPHPIAIFIVQWVFVVFVIAYIYKGISDITNGSKIKNLVFLFFLLPDTYELIFNAYRNNYYTLLCLWYFAFIFFTSKSGRKISTKEIILIAIYSAFLMVWRSEGILIGLGGLVFLMVFCSEHNRKNIVTAAVVLVAGFLVLHSFQGIGAKKYYGKDYMIINTTNVLRNVFNNPEADLSYDGAEEDLANIEKIIPIQVIKELGMDGYRQYNYALGRVDGNQSFAPDEDANDYMSSYYNIVFHNIGSYVNRQVYSFCECMGISFKPKVNEYTGASVLALPEYEFYQRDFGKEEYDNVYGNIWWSNNAIRQNISAVVTKVINTWNDWVNISRLNTLIKVLSLLGIVRLFIDETIRLIKREVFDRYSLFMSLIIFGEVFAISAFAPEGRLSYMFPMIYVCYFLIYTRVIRAGE